MTAEKSHPDGRPLGPVKAEDLKSVSEQMEDIHPDAWPARGSAKADGGGLRFNAGKNRMELVPPEWEWALGDVTTQGSKKYDERNWERGMDWSSMIGCMKRHLTKFLAGEKYDGDEFDIEAGTTGCHHLAMVAWNALALMSYDLRGVGNNDLPEFPKELLAMVNAVGAGNIPKEHPLGPNHEQIVRGLETRDKERAIEDARLLAGLDNKHASDCAVHNEPAYELGECDCIPPGPPDPPDPALARSRVA